MSSHLTPNLLAWSVFAGLIAPAIAYVFNGHFLERVTKKPVPEPIKGFVMLVAGALSGVIAQLADAGTVGFNQATFQAVEVALLSAIASHYGLRAGGINVLLNGGNTTGMHVASVPADPHDPEPPAVEPTVAPRRARPRRRA